MTNQITRFTLLLTFCAAALHAQTTSWDSLVGKTVVGKIEIVFKQHEPSKRWYRVMFRKTVAVQGNGDLVRRGDVKEIRVHSSRKLCDLCIGYVTIGFLKISVFVPPPLAYPLIAISLPATVAADALSLPAILGLDNLYQRIAGEKTLYRVIP